VSADNPALPGIQVSDIHGLAVAGWGTAALITLIVLVGALSVVLLVVGLRRARRPPVPITDEWSARTAMDELCPHGWQAQITVYGSSAPAPADAPAARSPQVSLDWSELSDGPVGPGKVAVVRRVWAPTIMAALARMVDDRRTDATLEEIERAGRFDGEAWD
jgi:hypothetical protein